MVSGFGLGQGLEQIGQGLVQIEQGLEKALEQGLRQRLGSPTEVNKVINHALPDITQATAFKALLG